MSTRYTFQRSENAAFIGHADEVSLAIKQLLVTMERNLQDDLASWLGDAPVQYAIAQQRWNGAADTMPRSLGVASDVLNRMTQTLQRTDANVAEMW
ncbi:WXG100 family type VII secretion target [Lentzea sp. BCCO 10_0061]|uniref:WXG100 family type VII secretion target n=1 Tax=Lentzea sokolovensis TaxID=3095429 RepID=A0ABU4VDK2_9PSEU|nr:WXG100 family type VII secretion target [Lentzea sp. BCCO 10_0061]MDX8149477.1 WXG100 family type VII secretion target [Lentzea sp. BCCO 10_0061]